MSLLNKLGNCKNPYQGEYKKVLCICSAGLLRSPTMAKVLSETYGYNTRAAGISVEYALIDVSEVLVEWADEVVVAEESIGAKFLHQYPDTPYICLDIPDKYEYMNEELQELIINQYKEKQNDY